MAFVRVRATRTSVLSAPLRCTKSVLLPSHENELGHSVDHRESYREMYTRKDRLGNREFPWPRVHPLGYGESFLFTKTK